MNYLKVRWLHDFPEEPKLLLSELDVDRYEIRKVELFGDGRLGFASSEASFGGTELGEGPIPMEGQISQDPQFVVERTDLEEFEALWLKATIGHSESS